MVIILSEPGLYTISMHSERVYLRTKRRHIEFKSCSKLYDVATLVLSNIDWRRQYLPDIVKEQEEDCFLQALQDFIVWYDSKLPLETMFTALHQATEILEFDQQRQVIHYMSEILQNRFAINEFKLFEAQKNIIKPEFDIDTAYKVLGKDYVDTKIAEGTLASEDHPYFNVNLEYIYTPQKREKFYGNYLLKNNSTKVGKLKLHYNFTLAEIEYEVREQQKQKNYFNNACC